RRRRRRGAAGSGGSRPRKDGGHRDARRSADTVCRSRRGAPRRPGRLRSGAPPMNRRILSTVAVMTGVAGALAATRPTKPPPAGEAPAAAPRAVLSAPGRIEGAGAAIELIPAVDGTIRAVFVSEGSPVRAGQVVARLDCADLEAEQRAAASRTMEARAALARLLRGGREDAQAEAMALVAAAEARANKAALD